MTNDDIKKTAIELCTTETQEEWLQDYGIHCFLDGARWRIENAWHDASKRPDENKGTIIERSNGRISFHEKGYDGPWKYNVKAFGFVRWAYIDDLLPDRKEAEQ